LSDAHAHDAGAHHQHGGSMEVLHDSGTGGAPFSATARGQSVNQ
jgi:hypothetical protein